MELDGTISFTSSVSRCHRSGRLIALLLKGNKGNYCGENHRNSFSYELSLPLCLSLHIFFSFPLCRCFLSSLSISISISSVSPKRYSIEACPFILVFDFQLISKRKYSIMTHIDDLLNEGVL